MIISEKKKMVGLGTVQLNLPIKVMAETLVSRIGCPGGHFWTLVQWLCAHCLMISFLKKMKNKAVQIVRY